MKTILVLTDLSEKAENAATYALKIAGKINAKIILYHAVEPHLLVDEGQANLIENDVEHLNILANKLNASYTGSTQAPAVEVISKNDDLGHSVKQLVLEREVDLIIMGSKSDNAIDDFLFGSDTYKVLDEANCPILFVPNGYKYSEFKTIVFSDDLKNKYPKAVKFLIDVAQIDNSEILITHFGEELSYNIEKYLDLYNNELHYPKVSIRQIESENVQDWLTEIITTIKADLLVMIYHEHKMYGKTIAGSNSKKMLYQHAVPLLILPD